MLAVRLPLVTIIALLSSPVFALEETVSGELGETLDAYLTSLEAKGISGAFLLAKDGEIVLAKGYGMANRDKGIPVTTETVFTVGSITKQFTGAAILAMEQAGNLSVQDPITKFFDDVPKARQGITIHHLLTHTAGLPGAVGRDFEPMSSDQIIEKCMGLPMFIEPGERHQYSNPGYSLLGAIIEMESGQSYEEYLNEHLFNPAGMSDTGYLLPNWNPDRVAHGYKEDGTDWGTVLDKDWDEDGPYWNLRANGGMHSTLGDMWKWHLALLEDNVLHQAAKDKFFYPHVREGEDANWHYGYGWAIAKTERGTTLITHNGGNGIFFADFRWYVDDEITIIYMTNTAQLFTDQHEQDIRRIAFGLPVESPTANTE